MEGKLHVEGTRHHHKLPHCVVIGLMTEILLHLIIIIRRRRRRRTHGPGSPHYQDFKTHTLRHTPHLLGPLDE
jgi:hypothetical protein